MAPVPLAWHTQVVLFVSLTGRPLYGNPYDAAFAALARGGIDTVGRVRVEVRTRVRVRLEACMPAV